MMIYLCVYNSILMFFGNVRAQRPNTNLDSQSVVISVSNSWINKTDTESPISVALSESYAMDRSIIERERNLCIYYDR